LVIADRVVIRGAQTLVRPVHSGLMIEFANLLTVSNGARLELGDAVFTGSVPLQLGSNSLVQLTGSLTSSVPVTLGGGTLLVDHLVAPQLTLTNWSMLTCQTSTTNQMHKLEIEVSGALIVSTNSRIDVSAKGYLPGRTTGNTIIGGATGRSGGSYGGLGTSWWYGGNVNAVYGDYADPEDWGSGGAQGSGGGLVQILADRLVLDGQLLADGAAVWESGGGSGGGISIHVSTLAGL
jgi:hypothetical protein